MAQTEGKENDRTAKEKTGGRVTGILVNLCRIVVAVAFIFSGFVKAVDPLGTQYKIADYLTAAGLGDIVPDWGTLLASVVLSATEFNLGLFLLFAIHRRTVSKLIVAFMAVMTVVTLWLWVANPISDCGCFGDAIHLSNGQTLAKNLVLTACALVVAWRPLCMVRFISESNQWIVINYSALFILAVSVWSLYTLPLFDFRPYHIGANIRQEMEIPEGETGPQFETTFIMEKNGEQREFTLDDYPDSTWTFVDSKTVQTAEGFVPPIHDFSIERMDTGDDITDEVIDNEDYTFLLVAPRLDKASDSNFGIIDELCEYAHEHGYTFLALTASGEEAIERWRELTGAEYDFCFTDQTTLKTIIRSNPGLMLIKKGTVIRKWSHNQLPHLSPEEAAKPLEQLEIGHMPKDGVAQKLAFVTLWFALPLFLLTLADRLWAWSKWLRKKSRKKKKETSAKQQPDNNNPINKLSEQ